jgi:hypothetical protein
LLSEFGLDLSGLRADFAACASPYCPRFFGKNPGGHDLFSALRFWDCVGQKTLGDTVLWSGLCFWTFVPSQAGNLWRIGDTLGDAL